MNIITITDDFDLKKIAESGQCFRVHDVGEGFFRFITGGEVLFIRKSGDTREHVLPETYEVSCTPKEWDEVWTPYFDLGRNYRSIRAGIPEVDTYMKNAAVCGAGIRILKQDPWEMLISFIISQRKSIPAIKSSIEMICARFGRKIVGDTSDIKSTDDSEDMGSSGLDEVLYAFPTAREIAGKVLPESEDGNLPREELFTALFESELKDCKLGYRLRYICDAVCRAIYGEIDLAGLCDFASEALLERLKEVNGVGDKVANCIALFSYGRCELAPVDTWIRKVIDSEYGGVNPFPGYGDVAGIMQQYIFYYALTHKQEF